jgi:hypothetical protein
MTSSSTKSCPFSRRSCSSACSGLVVLTFCVHLVASACFVTIRSGNQYCKSSSNHQTCLALSTDPSKSDRPKIHHTSRRRFLEQPILLTLLTMKPAKSNAACLPGDIRSECIGVYKMPLDDASLPYVETPEQLKKFAPDLNWVR